MLWSVICSQIKEVKRVKSALIHVSNQLNLTFITVFVWKVCHSDEMIIPMRQVSPSLKEKYDIQSNYVNKAS